MLEMSPAAISKASIYRLGWIGSNNNPANGSWHFSQYGYLEPQGEASVEKQLRTNDP